MAGVVGGHDGVARLALPALLDQIAERLIDEGLQLPPASDSRCTVAIAAAAIVKRCSRIVPRT